MTQDQAKLIPNYACQECSGVSAPSCSPTVADTPSIPDFNLLDHLLTCKSNLSILGNIPSGARISAADALNELISEVLRSNSYISWSKLLSFTYHCLQKPRRDKKAPNSPSLVTKIKNQISTFLNSELPDRFPFSLRTPI